MKVKAARHYYPDSAEWCVAVFPFNMDPDEHPGGWEFLVSARRWRAFGCRVPAKGEVVPASLHVEEITPSLRREWRIGAAKVEQSHLSKRLAARKDWGRDARAKKNAEALHSATRCKAGAEA